MMNVTLQFKCFCKSVIEWKLCECKLAFLKRSYTKTTTTCLPKFWSLGSPTRPVLTLHNIIMRDIGLHLNKSKNLSAQLYELQRRQQTLRYTRKGVLKWVAFKILSFSYVSQITTVRKCRTSTKPRVKWR